MTHSKPIHPGPPLFAPRPAESELFRRELIGLYALTGVATALLLFAAVSLVIGFLK